jgi:hypothetical protein
MTMLISATYICPIRGLVGLEPPEPVRLGQAAKVARGIGVERLMLPVLEEALLGTKRAKLGFLDGLIEALDQIGEAKLTAWLIAPAQRVLGLDWVAPHLVRAVRDPKFEPVFVDGHLRNLSPFDWWADPSLIQKRIKIFRELVAAISGHSALTGWLILDRALEWSRPELEIADWVLKSYLAEIRERDGNGCICLGLGWSELLEPEIAQELTGQVDGVRLSGCERRPQGLEKSDGLSGELVLVAYLATIARWLFGRPTEVEIGWGVLDNAGDPEKTLEACKRLAGQGLTGAGWLSLIDPEPGLYTYPPWVLRPGLDRTGLLDRVLEPKEHAETWLKAIRSSELRNRIDNFIDISPEEFRADPEAHLPRLWNHFRESS